MMPQKVKKNDTVARTGGADGQKEMRDLFVVLVRVPSLPSEQTTMMHVKYVGNKPTNIMSSCSVVLSIPIVHGKYSVFREF